MKTIVLTNKYPEGPLNIVKSVLPENFRLLMLDSNSQESLDAVIDQADYLLASGRVKIDSEILKKASKLKMIQRTGVGLDSLDLNFLKANNIPLYVNQGVNAESVAEHSLLLILSCLRQLTLVHNNTKNGIWKKQEQGVKTFELSRKTVCLFGMGNIARTLVKLLKPFGVSIFYYDKYRQTENIEKELGITYCGPNELFKKADILSLHCPLTDETKYLINKQTIELMKNGAVIVNTARGPLIKTVDLVDALNSGKISFAGLDVHENEPLTDDNPITKLDNVVLTSHIGGVTNDSFKQMMFEAMRNIKLFDENELDQIEVYKYKF